MLRLLNKACGERAPGHKRSPRKDAIVENRNHFNFVPSSSRSGCTTCRRQGPRHVKLRAAAQLRRVHERNAPVFYQSKSFCCLHRLHITVLVLALAFVRALAPAPAPALV